MIRTLKATVICAALTAALPAYAHVTIEQRNLTVGEPAKIVLRVPHGCGDSPTVSITVRIPEGVIAIKPMVKAGWQLSTKRGAYEKSYSYFHGATFSEGVKEVTWNGGNLPNAYYDEFAVTGFVAGDLAAGKTLYFPVVQKCEKGEHNWVEIPDKPDAHPNEPAPSVVLSPKK